MVEDLIKKSSEFGLTVVQKGIVAIAMFIAIIVGLFILNAGVDVAINVVKALIDLLQYAATTLL